MGIESALRRQRRVTIAALFLLTLLAWSWLVLGAGMGMPMNFGLDFLSGEGGHQAMSGSMTMAAPTAWGAAQFWLAFSMWWVMMVATMLPAAAPVILLYSRAASARAGTPAPANGHFLAGYLLIWGLFSLAAACIQAALQSKGLLAPMTMAVAGSWLSALILIAAGIYQLSPLKDACLAHCRNPAAFLALHYRRGPAGALRLGAIHGAYCLGCCWLLMGLLFVGGVMNLAWIALLTLLVAAEKLMPGGRRLALATGPAFILWGVSTLFV